MTDITAWHGKTVDEHVHLRDSAAKSGYRFLSLSLHGTVSAPRYSAVMIKRPNIVAQRDWPLLTAAELQATFNDQAGKGFGPAIISATGSAADPRFAIVFEARNPIPLTRSALRSGASTDLGTIQGMNAKARADGLMPRWTAAYGTAGDPRYAAIWMPNTAKIVWNADGILDTSTEYQARFEAQVSGWCRPQHVTLSGDQRYFSSFGA